jgi:hypothetical protein
VSSDVCFASFLSFAPFPPTRVYLISTSSFVGHFVWGGGEEFGHRTICLNFIENGPDIDALLRDHMCSKQGYASVMCDKKGVFFIVFAIRVVGKFTPELRDGRLISQQAYHVQVERTISDTHRKKWAFQTNKHAPKIIQERIASVQSYVRGRGSTVSGHVRSTGKCRAFQTLPISLLDNVLRGIYETQRPGSCTCQNAIVEQDDRSSC